MSLGYSSSYGLFQDSASGHTTDIPLPKNTSTSSLRYIPENVTTDGSDQKPSLDRGNSQEIIPEDEDDEDDKNNSYTYSATGPKAKSSHGFDKTRKRSSTNGSRDSKALEVVRAPSLRNVMTADALSNSTHEITVADAADGDDDTYMPRRCFLGRSRVQPNSVLGPNGLVVRRSNYSLEQEVLENSSPFLPPSENRHAKRRTVQYKPSVSIVLPPNARKAITLQVYHVYYVLLNEHSSIIPLRRLRLNKQML